MSTRWTARAAILLPPKCLENNFIFFCLGLDIWVSQVVKTNLSQLVLLQEFWEFSSDKIRLQEITHGVYADEVHVFPVIHLPTHLGLRQLALTKVPDVLIAVLT